MPKLSVDGVEVEVAPGATLMQACEKAGAEIPRFCFHERLSIAGNCRMCLVELVGVPKPVASCAMPAADDMEISTRSTLVTRAREGVMEFLLVNHPLDCPICDQGGECDLQDQALHYGRGISRFREGKRAVPAKDFGPLIKTEMTRCIHCTRCVRFMNEVAGVHELGTFGRGEDMEIDTVVQGGLHSELSGNIVDLCPVGALTSKPYAFTARPWELSSVESVDAMDALGAAVRVDSRDGRVMRILPRVNEEVNEEWLSDRSRFACDGLAVRRLDRPWVRRDGKFHPANWEEAFETLAGSLKDAGPLATAAIAGDQADLEAMTALADFLRGLGTTSFDCRQDGAFFPPGVPASWRFNATLAGIARTDAVLIVGANPRREAPLANVRIRARWRAAGIPVARIGPPGDLTYPVDELGVSPDVLEEIASGRHPFAKVLAESRQPMILVGTAALARPDGAGVLARCRAIAEAAGAHNGDWNGFSVLHTAAARVGGLEIGFVPGEGGRDTAGILEAAQTGEIQVVWLLGADEIKTKPLKNAFVIYQGHHADAGAAVADVLLPGAAWTEKRATFVNTEGRPQRAYPAVDPPGEAREDWRIIRALSERIGSVLPYDSLEELRERISRDWPHLAEIGALPPPAGFPPFGDAGAALDASPLGEAFADYYRTCPISRASATMAACAAAFSDG